MEKAFLGLLLLFGVYFFGYIKGCKNYDKERNEYLSLSHSLNEQKKKNENHFQEKLITYENKLKAFNESRANTLKALDDKEKKFINFKEKELLSLENSIKAFDRNRENELKILASEKNDFKQKQDIFNTLVNLKVKEFPILGMMLSDIAKQEDETREQCLKYKLRPALVAAETVKEISLEKRQLLLENKALEYKIKYYESTVPWLSELSDEDIVLKKLETFNPEFKEHDAAGLWLSSDEYISLSSTEKYQRALDRYFQRKKTNWEIGRDYERYIGYVYEQKNFTVQYRGIIDGLEDMGRDLICVKNDIIHIVQCKYWSSKKTIHEKHINQLFGTTAMYYLSLTNNMGDIVNFYQSLCEKKLLPVFVTSTNYSNTALSFAKSLGVSCRSNVKLEKYPMIKCNINHSTGEKIYHLPFDQQYDKVKIDSPGEFYALTVLEAEKQGFRRAMRWKSSD